MTRTDDQPIARGSAPTHDTAGTQVFPARTRILASCALAAVAVAAMGLSAHVTDDRNGYVLAHALSAAPFLLGAMACAHHARRAGPPQLAVFWQRWIAACGVAALATAAAIASVALRAPALLAVDAALLVGAAPLWASAARHMLRAQAGQRDTSVDIIDSTMALVVLSAPGVLLIFEPVLRSSEPLFAVLFALFLVVIPAGLYTALLNLARVPAGERVVQGLGVGIATAFALSASLQLAHVVDHLELPLPVFVGFHVLNLSLIVALPLWSHRVTAGGLGRLPVERQVRRTNPMSTVSAVVLPVLAVFVFVWRDDDPWATGYLTAVLLAVIVLNAVRHSLLTRESGRLSGLLAGMAEERRQLLAGMVRALDDDRRRSVSELHTQAIGSLSTLGTIVQTACVSLPPATAEALRETLVRLQGDLAHRAEELRRLLVAMRPPPFDDADGATPRSGGDEVLTAALRAYASELLDEAPLGAQPAVRVDVDPALDLDRTTLTIVYRIAQEALLNAARHARAHTVEVTVRVADDASGVVIEVADDGIGFDPNAVREGSGLASIRLFTDLGRGDLSVRSRSGGGTVVCSRLGVCPESRAARDRPAGEPRSNSAASARPSRRHLRLVPAVEVTGPPFGPE